MRFGSILRKSIYGPWAEHYLDYDQLKKLLREHDNDDEEDDNRGEAAAGASADGGQGVAEAGKRSTASGAASSDRGSGNDDPWTDDDEGAFVAELVNVQLEKVHAFHARKSQELRERLARCEAALDEFVHRSERAGKGKGVGGSGEESSPDDDYDKSNSDGEAAKHENGGEKEDGDGGKSEGIGEQDEKESGQEAAGPLEHDERQKWLRDVLEDLDGITKEISELERFSRINFTGFLKAAKKHDRKRGSNYRVQPLLQVRLGALPFNSEDYSPLLYRLSVMYSFIRQHLDDPQHQPQPASADAQAGGVKYISYKYWVHQDNVMEVKTYILRRLPLLVYNPQHTKAVDSAPEDPSITSLYFDNPAFALYTQKVERAPQPSSLRLRWHGKLRERPELFLERKTILDGGTSDEQRIAIKAKYVQPFLSGTYAMEKSVQKRQTQQGQTPEALAQYQQTVGALQHFVRDMRLEPMLRANYSRTAFQVPGDDRVRMALDTNLVFVREDSLDTRHPCRERGTWHRRDVDEAGMEYPFAGVPKREKSEFPHAVLEIKLREDFICGGSSSNNKSDTNTTNVNRSSGGIGRGSGGSGQRLATTLSEWVADLMSSHLVKETPRFSKFVHGVAVLFEDHVNSFPFWLSELDRDIRQDPAAAFEAEQEKAAARVEDELAVGSLLTSQQNVHSIGGGVGSGPAALLASSPPPAAALMSSSPIATALRPRQPPGGGTAAVAFGRESKPTLVAQAKQDAPKHSPPGLAAAAAEHPSAAEAEDTEGAERRREGQKATTRRQEGEEEEGAAGGQSGSLHRAGSRRWGAAMMRWSLLPAFSRSKFARARRPLPPGVRHPGPLLKDSGPVRVEPKVWLANERTFIRWQHMAVLLASLALALFNAASYTPSPPSSSSSSSSSANPSSYLFTSQDPSSSPVGAAAVAARRSGSSSSSSSSSSRRGDHQKRHMALARRLALVYAALAVFAGAWGWYMYVQRARLIARRSGKDLDNIAGPIVLCVGLILALCVNCVLKNL